MPPKNSFDNLRDRAEKYIESYLPETDSTEYSDLKKILHELKVYQIELEMQNEQLRQTQVDLMESRNRFQNLYNFSPTGYLTMDENGSILEINATGCEMFQSEPQKIINRSLSTKIYKKDQEKFSEFLQQVFASNRNQTCEIRIVVADNEKKFIRLEGARQKAAAEPSYVCWAAMSDISAQKAAEAELRQSEKRFRDIAFSMADWIWEVDRETRYTYASGKVRTLLGYEPEEIIGRTPFEFMLPSEVDRVAEEYHRAISKQKPFTNLENWNVTRDGRNICLLTNGVPIFDANGTFTGYRGVDIDVTREKLAVQALQQSEQFLQETMNALLTHLSILDEDGTIVSVNEAWRRFADENNWPDKTYGVGSNYIEVCERSSEFDSQDAAIVADGIRAVINGQQDKFEFEYPCDCVTEQRWFLLRVSKFAIQGKNYIIVAHENITQRKQAEITLADSEELHRLTLSNISDAVFITDEVGHFTFICINVDYIFGYSIAEVEAFQNIHHLLGDDLPPFERVLAEGEIANVELKIMNKRGQRRIVLTSMKAVDIKQGSILITCHDITERKKAIVEQVRTDRRYRALIEDMPILVCRYKADGELTFVNEAYCRYFKKEKSELVGHNFFEFIPPEARASAWQHLRSLTPDHPVQTYEHEVIDPRGQRCWQRWTDRALFNEQNEVYEYQSMGEDISERKFAEIALQESEARYRFMIENATDMISQHDENGVYLYVTSVCQRILGYAPEELVGQSAYVYFHPDDLKKIHNSHREIIEQESRTIITYRLRHKNGSYIWVETNSQTIRHPQSKRILEIIAVTRDISDRKTIEERAEWASKVNRVMADVAEKILVMESFEEITGYFLEEAKYLTESRFGFVGYIEESTGYMINPTLTNEIWDECRVNEKSIVFKKFVGLWGWVLNNKKSLLSNNPQAEPMSSGVPPGHLPIERFLSAPALVGDILVGQIALANPTRDYTQRDLEFVERLAGLFAVVILKKQAEEAMRKSEETARSLIDTPFDAVMLVDLPGKIIDLNETMANRLGHPIEEIIGTNVYDYLPPHLAEKRREWAQRVIRNKMTVRFEEEHENLWNDNIISPIFDEKGEVVQLTVLAHDITQHKEIEKILQKARDAAETASRAKSEFLANMSHELRTPLNGILGYAQILKRDPELSAEHIKGIQVIENSGHHLLNLINDILDLAKIESKKLELHNEPFNLRRMLDRVVEMNKPHMDQKGLVFHYNVSENLPRSIYGDPKQLSQVLINLLGNAVKFTKAGSITFQVDRQTDRLMFEIIDTGLGIPADRLDDIFSPFSQLNRPGKFEGTGLGLTISRRLLNLMGCELQVESQVGQGSRFWFELPVQVSEIEGETPPAQLPQVIGYEGPRQQILVVDDRWENRQICRNMLQPLGFQIAECESGEAAIEYCQAKTPDLILMDLVMPALDGFETSQAIRQLPNMQSVKIVVLSATVNDDVKRKSFEVAQDYLPKPIEYDKLLELLQQHLNLKWLCAPDERGMGDRQNRNGDFGGDIPNREEMQKLFDLIDSGDIFEFKAEVEKLPATNPKLSQYAEWMINLADEFQLNEIVKILRHALEALDDSRQTPPNNDSCC